MWQTKYFKTYEQAQSWITKNYHKYQMELIFINQKTEKSAGYFEGCEGGHNGWHNAEIQS